MEKKEPGPSATTKLLDLLHTGRHAECELAAAYLLDRYPEYGFGWKILGVALQLQGRRAQAFRALYRAAELLPHDIEAQGNLGLTLLDAAEWQAAEQYLRRALEIDPADANACNNLGHGLCRMGRLEEAEAYLRRAVALRPDAPDFLHNIASVLQDQGRIAEAIEGYEKVLAIAPLFPHTHWNLGMCLLQIGDFSGGWNEYEWRWKTPALLPLSRMHSGIRWTGAPDLEGKTILLYAEQGLGDTLQFCRYASVLAERGARVVLYVPTALVALLTSLDGVAEVCDSMAEAPPHDFYCPMMSLPLACGTELTTIPAPPAYLHTPPDRVEAWRQKLDAIDNGKGPRIGVVWGGNHQHKHDYRRSIALDQFAPVMTGDYRWFCLQTELSEAERERLRAMPHCVQFADSLTDLGDTAALIAQLDLVLTVDTAAAHLAAAMGKPTWLLLSYQADWRWLERRDDSPWYPSMRLFRQGTAGDWDGVLGEVASALREVFSV
jgi:Flp pilus assembly protein TadD